MNTACAQIYLTVTEIAERLGEPHHRVRYALEVNSIPHAVQIGGHIGYAQDVVEIVRSRLLIDRRLGTSKPSISQSMRNALQ